MPAVSTRVSTAKSTKTKVVGGRVVSAKSKTGDPACSQAMSTWKTTGMTALVAAVLGKCRAKAKALKESVMHRAAGNVAGAAKRERLARISAGGEAPIAASARVERAKELVKARADKKAAPKVAAGPSPLKAIIGRAQTRHQMANARDIHNVNMERSKEDRERFRSVPEVRKIRAKYQALPEVKAKIAAQDVRAAIAERKRFSLFGGQTPEERPHVPGETPKVAKVVKPKPATKPSVMAKGRGTAKRIAKAREIRESYEYQARKDVQKNIHGEYEDMGGYGRGVYRSRKETIEISARVRKREAEAEAKRKIEEAAHKAETEARERGRKATGLFGNVMGRYRQAAAVSAASNTTGYKKQTIHLTAGKGVKTPVEAQVKGDLAIHKSIDRSDYTITHVPTGLRLGDAPSQVRAKEIVGAIQTRGIDLERLKAARDPKQIKYLKSILASKHELSREASKATVAAAAKLDKARAKTAAAQAGPRVNPDLKNEELHNFLEEHPGARMTTIPIKGALRDKIESTLDYWKRNQPKEYEKVIKLTKLKEIPPPIVQEYSSGTVGIPDGFHRIAAYHMLGRSEIKGYLLPAKTAAAQAPAIPHPPMEEHIKQVAARMVAEGRHAAGKPGHVTTHDLRDEMQRARGMPPSNPQAKVRGAGAGFDKERTAAAHAQATEFDREFEKAIKELDRQEHGRLVAVGDPTRFTREQLDKMVPGVEESFSTYEVPGKPARKKKRA